MLLSAVSLALPAYFSALPLRRFLLVHVIMLLISLLPEENWEHCILPSAGNLPFFPRESIDTGKSKKDPSKVAFIVECSLKSDEEGSLL